MVSEMKGQKEFKVFEKWVEKCPYPIIPDSIKNEDCPKPDISCKLENGTSIAFELVEIIDEGFARRFSNKLELEKKFSQTLKDFPVEDQRRFENRRILIIYNHEVTKTKKISMIPRIIKYVLEKGCKIGNYCFHNEPYFKGALRSVSTIKSVSSEPRFDVSDFGSVGNPELEQIKKKFGKSYETSLKIELLAYSQLYPELQECLWLPNVRKFVEANIVDSPFEKVWIYSINQGEIIYRFPS